jgi:hypothetical protein
VADQIVQRGLSNTICFGPGCGVCAQIAVINLHRAQQHGRQAGEDGDDHP